MIAAIASGSQTWNGNCADLVNAASATSVATVAVNVGSDCQTGWAKISLSTVVPVIFQVSATAISRKIPPMKVMSSVRMDAASPDCPALAMSRKEAREVSSHAMNSTTRSPASTRPSIEVVNMVMTR